VQGRGQGTAVDDLVAAHADAVYRYALRLTRHAAQAEDLMQETLLRGWRRRHKLRDPAATRVWLLSIATNVHRDWVRAKRDMAPLVAEAIDGAGGGVERRLEQRECVTAALAALDELPARQRQVMHLVTVEGLANEQAAEVLGISVDAVKASLSVARQAMREKLKDIYDEVRGARLD
jgi:RNA polymerase sigma-70 factor, ECF subfamily